MAFVEGSTHVAFKLQHFLVTILPQLFLFLKKWANPGLFSFIFVLFTLQFKWQIQIEKSIDNVLGTWTRGGKMEGADESTELWRHPYLNYFFMNSTYCSFERT